MIFLKEADDETAEIKRSFNIRNRNLRKENRMSRKIGLALMVAAGLPVCAARAAEVSSGAEFAAALAGGDESITLNQDISITETDVIDNLVGTEVVIDGQGNAISNNGSKSVFYVRKEEKLTLKNIGNGYRVAEEKPVMGNFVEFIDVDGRTKYAVADKSFNGFAGNVTSEEGGGTVSLGGMLNEGTADVVNTVFYNDNGSDAVIYNSAEMSIKSTAFIGNKNESGSALDNTFGARISQIVDSAFIKNSSGMSGGAISNSGEIDGIDGTFVENSTFRYGGAIFNQGQIKDIAGNFIGNTSDSGGAIRNNMTIGQISASFINNVSESNGGAIYNNGNLSKISNSEFRNNGGKNGGAIFLASRAKQLKVEYANFVGNNAKDGGAISNVSDYGVSVKSSRFENNSAQYGGAISDWVSESDMSVADSDFIANKGALGGAVAVWDTAANKVLISGSAFEHNESEHGGAIFNRGDGIIVENSSFKGNTASSIGGAIYSEGNLTVRADGGVSVFSGNTANGESNAVYMVEGKTLLLEAKNDGKIVSDDGFTGSEDGWTLVLSGDDNGEITLNGEIKNAEIVSGIAKGNGLTGVADAAVTNIAGGNLIGNGTNSLAMNGGLVNIQSLGFERLQLKNLALNGGKLDIYNVNADLENVKMGEMSAEEVSGDLALVEVKSLDVLSDGEAETTHVMFADNNILAGQVASQIAESAGPVYNYDVEYLPENGEFTFTRRERKDKFNPEVLESGMAVVASIGVLNDEIYSRVLADADRTAFRKGAAEAGGGAWVKPFASSDDLEFKNYHGADARFNGVIAGADSRVKTYGNGVAAVYSAYGAYADGEAEFAAGKIEQNVWYLGAGANFYKGSAFWGITANAGYARKKANDFDKNGKFDAWLGGIGAKFGYNCVLGNGWTVQPNFYATYTYADAEDYTTGKNAEVAFDGLSMYELAPGLKIEKAFNDELQVYAKGRYVYTGTGLQHVTANGVHLPDMEIEPYAEYGLGFESSNGDASLFAEVMRRDGGRTGWNGLAGLKINF